MAMVRRSVLAYLAERSQRRAIADLESLPRAILRDIGIRREEIPLVVTEAARVQLADGAGGDLPASSTRESALPTASGSDPASQSKVA